MNVKLTTDFYTGRKMLLAGDIIELNKCRPSGACDSCMSGDCEKLYYSTFDGTEIYVDPEFYEVVKDKKPINQPKTKLQDDIDKVFEVLKERLPKRNELDNLELATVIANRLNGINLINGQVNEKVFYIDVGNMSKKKAEKYVLDLIKKWEKS